jgi:hypothetical protein
MGTKNPSKDFRSKKNRSFSVAQNRISFAQNFQQSLLGQQQIKLPSFEKGTGEIRSGKRTLRLWGSGVFDHGGSLFMEHG